MTTWTVNKHWNLLNSSSICLLILCFEAQNLLGSCYNLRFTCIVGWGFHSFFSFTLFCRILSSFVAMLRHDSRFLCIPSLFVFIIVVGLRLKRRVFDQAMLVRRMREEKEILLKEITQHCQYLRKALDNLDKLLRGSHGVFHNSFMLMDFIVPAWDHLLKCYLARLAS